MPVGVVEASARDAGKVVVVARMEITDGYLTTPLALLIGDEVQQRVTGDDE